MNNLTRKLLALLLVVCLCACMVPTVSAAGLPVSEIALEIDQIHTTEGYEFVYYAELTMEEDMASFVTLYKERWDWLSKLRFTCTLSDELTAMLTANTAPEYVFASCKLNGKDIFIPVSAALENGALVLVYRLNPAIQEDLATTQAGRVKSALCELMYMQSNPGFIPVQTIGSLTEVNTTATIHLSASNGALLPGYSQTRALVASGAVKTTLNEKITFTGAPVEETGIDSLIETRTHVQILQGFPEGAFYPKRAFTRAEAAVTVYRMLLPEVKASADLNNAPKFTDVKPGSWYAEAVNTLAALGFLRGTGRNKFEPSQPISRADFTVLLTRLANPVAPEAFPADFSDLPTTHYAYEHVMTAAAYGWVAGTGDNKFNPTRSITREEACKMFCMFLNRRPDKFAIRRGEFKPFSDVDPSSWSYDYIVEVTTPHDYQNIGGFELWTSVYSA